MGAFAAVAQGSDARAAADHAAPRARGRARPAARARRQGGDVRHRRLLDQAGRAHARDEVRHVRRRGGARGDGGDRARSGCRSALVAVVGATENMVSARAVRPGDIVRSRAGITIEINNTDAEGRLVLADCLTHAREQGAERLVDLATLTGGIVTTLRARPRRADGQRRRLVRGDQRGRRGHGRARLAAAARPGLRRADQGPLRRHREQRRGPQGALDHRRRVPAPLRRRRAVGAPRHRGRGRRARPAVRRDKGASGWGVRLLRRAGARPARREG